MAYPPPRRSPLPLVLVLALAVTLVLIVAVVGAAAVLLAQPDDPAPAPSTPVAAQPLSADGIVDLLDAQGLVERAACRQEDGSAPATSQVRCDLSGGTQLIAIGFEDGDGVRSRLEGWTPGITLVQGPNWLVNVGDLDNGYQEAIRAALGGSLVTVAG
ncbi:hypothetical protein GWI34_03670 [Actinomadura sp. DSM 109109]|nr:hypothetical protein [Actinomadura lepetitiana]